MKTLKGDIVINKLGINGTEYNKCFTVDAEYKVIAGYGDICQVTGKKITMVGCANVIDDCGSTRLIIVGDNECAQYFETK